MYPKDTIHYRFFLFDVLAVTVVMFAMAYFYPYTFWHSKFFVFALAMVLLSNLFTKDYVLIYRRGYLKELQATARYSSKLTIWIIAILTLGRFRYLQDISQVSYQFFIYLFLSFLFSVYLERYVIKRLSSYQEATLHQVLLISDGEREAEIAKLRQSGYQVLAYVSHQPIVESKLKTLASKEALRDFIAHHQVDALIVSRFHQETLNHFGNTFRLLEISTFLPISYYDDFYVGDSTITKIGERTYLATAHTVVSAYQLLLKRIIDLVIGFVGLLLALFVACLIFPIVKLQSPGPLLFKQKRIGQNGKVFEMYKFRSMYTDAEERKKDLLAQNDLDSNLMFKMEDDPRIFPFGHKLRAWSLDELPQFLNVLKGEMSVVGTRPPTLDEYRHYELEHFKRLTTKPGITGLWQISGRSDITDFEEVVALDMKYIQNWSIGEDIKIIAKTFGVVLKREGSR